MILLRRILRDAFPGSPVTVPLADIYAARKPSAARPLKRGHNGRFIRAARLPQFKGA